jgi:hypothetical protein
MKISSYLSVLIFFLTLSGCTTKYYEGNHIEIKDDLIYYDSQIIENGIVTGIYKRYLFGDRFGVPKDAFNTPLNMELDVEDGKIISARMYGKEETEKVKIETMDGEKYWRYSTLEGEFKDGFFYHYFPDGSIEEKFESYYKGGTFYIKGKYIKYDKNGQVIKEESLKDKRFMSIV